MPALPKHLRLPLTRRFQTTLSVASDRAAQSFVRQWDDLDSYNDDDIESFTVATARPAAALKSAAVAAAVGYYAVLSGKRATVGADDLGIVPNVRGPFLAVWHALSEGRSPDDAVDVGRSQVEALASDYANSTARQAGGLFVERADIRVHGWERVPDGNACPWCIEVADATYSSADAADFGHSNCRCVAAPLL